MELQMNSKSELNKLILETIDAHCKNDAVQELIHRALQYELDIWNRHIGTAEIIDEYQRTIEKIVKENKDAV
jgi:hypothetical protein